MKERLELIIKKFKRIKYWIGGDLMDELMERYEKLHQAIRRVSKNRCEYVDDVDMLINAEEEFCIVFEEFLEELNN